MFFLWFFGIGLTLTVWAQAPKNDFRLMDDKSVVGGRFQTGSRADSAVHIGCQTATAADKVMVIVANARLIACRMAGRLDSSNKPSLLECVQIVVNGLCGEGAKPLAGSDRNGLRIPMTPLALDRHENS